MKHGKEMFEKTNLAMKLVKAVYDHNFKQALESYTKLVNGEAKDGAANEKVAAVKTTAAKPKATGTAHNSNHNDSPRGMCVSLITTDMDRKVCGQFKDKRFIYAIVDRNSGRLLADAKDAKAKEGVCVFLKYNKDGKFDGCPSGAEKVQLSTTKMMCIKSLEKGKESHSSGEKYGDKKENYKKETTTSEES